MADLLKVFGMEYADCIMISGYLFEALGKLKEDKDHTSCGLKALRLTTKRGAGT